MSSPDGPLNVTVQIDNAVAANLSVVNLSPDGVKVNISLSTGVQKIGNMELTYFVTMVLYLVYAAGVALCMYALWRQSELNRAERRGVGGEAAGGEQRLAEAVAPPAHAAGPASEHSA